MIHPKCVASPRQHATQNLSMVTERGENSLVMAPPVGLEPATSGDVSRKIPFFMFKIC